VPGTTGVGTMVELADQFHRTLESMKVTITVIADVHQVSTDRAIAIQNVELPHRKIGIHRPMVRHRADLPALVRFFK
jgi:hypothetical protein